MTGLLEAGHASGPIPMVLLGGSMIGIYVLIATGKLHKLTAALLGGIVCTALGLVLGVLHDYGVVHKILAKDLNVLGVIVGTSILVDISGRSGLFQFLAIKIAKKAKGDPARLFTALMGLTVLFVSVLTIAPGTLIVVSLALVLARTLDLNPAPYLIGVAVVANSGALVTFASGICTLMVGSAAGIPYVHFLQVSLPAALFTAVVAWWVIGRRYRGSLTAGETTPDERRTRIESFDEYAMITDRRVFRRCAWILGVTIAGFALAQPLGVGLDFVAIAGGAAALFLSGHDPEEAVKKVNWTVILFFVGLFVMIGVVEETGLLQLLASGMASLSGGNVQIALVLLIVFTAVTSGIMDNIPVAATLIPIVKSMIGTGLAAEPLWWGLIISANLGGNGTPIGSISCVIALHALTDATGRKVSWGEYLRAGGLTLALQVLLVIAYLLTMTVFDLFPTLPTP
ncbi:MAG: SLC13 family permease [Planctomycetota bacterium]